MRKIIILVLSLFLALGARGAFATSIAAEPKAPPKMGKLPPPPGQAAKPTAKPAAKKKPAKPPKPWSKMTSNQKGQSFTETYNQKKGAGGKEFYDFKKSIYEGAGEEGAEKVDMFNNLEKGKTAGGNSKSSKQRRKDAAAQAKAKAAVEAAAEAARAAEKAKGWMGDKDDPGPTDWSDYDMDIDENGNFKGFKPKEDKLRDKNKDGVVSEQEALDYEKTKADGYMDTDNDGEVSNEEKKAAAKEMDKDGDGEVSQEELEAWNDRKDKEKQDKKNKANGGAPGEVPPVADWDEDSDGVPDDDFFSCLLDMY